ncbi:MAG: alpha/beta hydrolase [Reyranella sp.]|uniref:alpha/beta hydrolase n=1 Tax=Reyranella sp. TaxID=1929291 RepID=UPI00121B609A|nr:alpha/beta hydrolase [Reyranella sp.]TAJ92862.1 MAG: alpha/beta hydrolase [Reyranella sp.]TBR27026.1 MAG: alpha/beta hydrolase [Reyranella sp.]
MKRRALLLGALLMPTAAHAQPKKPKKPSKRQAPKPAAKTAPVHAAKPAPAAPPLGLKEPKTQLAAFDASPFPYRGFIPDTTKPFLDARDGKRRGHTTGRGDVYWEDVAYSDRRSLLYLPQGFDPARPVLILLFLHGQGATLERDVVLRQAVPRQVDESGKNIALVAPQLAYDALDSSAGNFWRGGHFARYVDEAAERLMRLYGNRSAGRGLNLAPVTIAAYSGGYLSAAYALERGGANHRVNGLILLDALYGDEDKFAAWFAARRRQAFLLSAFTDSTKDENATLQGLLAKRRITSTRTVPKALTPGTACFLGPTGGLDMHGDFVTRAWQSDPLKQALSMIPGFAPVHGKKSA